LDGSQSRFFQILLIVSTIAFSWLAMMGVHELGHVVHLEITGGSVKKVVLHPLEISRTDPGENPHPLAVAWGGPLWGSLVPLAILLGVRLAARPYVYLARFFAGFCLIANGGYLAGDALVRGGDGRELIAHGTPPCVLPLVGLPLVAFGLALWNGLGPHFGLGAGKGRVDRRAAIGMCAALAGLVALELILFAG
jgi:hypothetical protein